jgi:hypothetical protein
MGCVDVQDLPRGLYYKPNNLVSATRAHESHHHRWIEACGGVNGS